MQCTVCLNLYYCGITLHIPGRPVRGGRAAAAGQRRQPAEEVWCYTCLGASDVPGFNADLLRPGRG